MLYVDHNFVILFIRVNKMLKKNYQNGNLRAS